VTFAKVDSQVHCVTDRELVRFAEALAVDPSELLPPPDSDRGNGE
jgi:hypothetical protein